MLEQALSEVNGHLISRRELQYVHRLLRLPGHCRLNFRLFSIVAALSEKIVQLEPMLRKLVNKVDFDALDFKIDRCRELFHLLESGGTAPPGCIPIEGLAVELLAGNLKDEHFGSVMRKLTREKKGHIDFLEFLTYVPLFLEIHQRIVADPLSSDAQW
uniref:EF-hand domain-containing protein n=1 Tax=Macrostomum lignano TaxID=282301 RepID=A0A1I8GKL1_9PLAT